MVLTALLMAGLFGMVAFAVDTGWILYTRTDLQRTADACALAAAGRMPSTSDVATIVQDVAGENGWSSEVRIGDGDAPLEVDFGFWDRDTATFTTPAPGGRTPNAVRVTLRRTQASRNPLGLFFSRVLGTSQADVSASATAWYDRGVCGPFVGIDWLKVGGGASTDSYDSSEGPYSAALARDRGSICSDGPVDVSGNSIIRGDALAGKGQPLPDISGTAVITGHLGNRVTPLDLPPVDPSQAAAVNDNAAAPPVWQGQSWRQPIKPNGDFSLNAGEVYNLPPGTYWFRNVTLNGGSTLNITGETKIYITGDLRREGGCYVNNNTRLARNLQINVSGSTVNVTSDNPFYGVLYAPQSRVTLNASSDLFGAIIGGTLSVSGSGIGHYDESLNLDYVEVPRRTMLVD
jgi:Flp pilus assembly protein TadG